MPDNNTALTLPDEDTFRHNILAINRFQQVVRATMVDGQDYGTIPGTKKPTLLKPGAEKIAKLLGLSDQYEIVDRQENWDKGFFRYLIKCKLISINTDVLISEGLGECNSMESKYRWRWLGERDLPAGVDKSKLVSEERKSKTGGHWTVYRFENDDIYTQVNTLLKMAKKRALVDAALSAGRLSEVFTQDVEDMNLKSDVVVEADVVAGEPTTASTTAKEHWCEVHSTEWFKRGKMKGYAHPIGETGEWCNEPDPAKEPAAKPAKATAAPATATAKTDPAKLVKLSDLYAACFRDFKWQPADVNERLGVKGQQEITDTPAACYEQLSRIYDMELATK